jgi:hypothetical protein
MRGIKYLTERNQTKIQKTRFEKLNLENDVINDALKVISKKNFKLCEPSNDIGTFGDMCTGRISDKNCVGFVWRYRAIK